MLAAILSIALLAPAARAEAPQAGLIDINAATPAQLATLTEVDGSEAERIVALRDSRGRIPNIEALRVLDLDEVTLDALRGGTEIAMPVVKVQNAKRYGSVAEVMAEFAGEPTIAEVQQMAMQYTTTHPDMVRSWLSASRSTFLLPQLDVKYRKELDLNEDFTYEQEESGDLTQNLTSGDVDNDDTYEIKLSWDLQKLIMSSERIRVISEAQDVAKLRDKVLEDVTRLYFDRRRHQVEVLLNPPGSLDAQIEAELRSQELTATLDAFTGGAFSATLSRR